MLLEMCTFKGFTCNGVVTKNIVETMDICCHCQFETTKTLMSTNFSFGETCGYVMTFILSFTNMFFPFRFFLISSCDVKYKHQLSTAHSWMMDANGKEKSDIQRYTHADILIYAKLVITTTCICFKCSYMQTFL